MNKYGDPSWGRLQEFFPRLDQVTVYAIAIDRMTGKETPLPPLQDRWPAADHTKTPDAVHRKGRRRSVRIPRLVWAELTSTATRPPAPRLARRLLGIEGQSVGNKSLQMFRRQVVVTALGRDDLAGRRWWPCVRHDRRV